MHFGNTAGHILNTHLFFLKYCACDKIHLGLGLFFLSIYFLALCFYLTVTAEMERQGGSREGE